MALSCGCPETIPDWHNRDIDLGGQAALILPLPTFLHMPMGYDLYRGRLRHLVQQLELPESWPGLTLTRTGWWRGEIIALLKNADSPSHQVKRLPSPFKLRGKLHKGGMETARNSVRELQSQLLDAGRMPKELYLAYLTCPNCRDQRGGDQVLLLRRYEESPRLAQRLKQR